MKVLTRLLLCIVLLSLLAGCAATSPLRGPAEKYLPSGSDLPDYLQPVENIALENLSERTELRVLPEDRAYRNYDNNGFSFTSEPQNGVYLRLAYWLLLFRGPQEAKDFYTEQSAQETARKNFIVVVPASVLNQVEKMDTLAPTGAACQETSLYKISSRVVFSPDLYLYAACRVDNAVLLLWAYTPDNADGENTPLAADVAAAQMNDWLKVVTGKLR